jgi:uncharacterized protein (UPF0332 family)
MNIDKLFEDRKYLDEEIRFFTSKKQMRRIEENKELVDSHMKKARHNLAFYKLNKEHDNYGDWLIVALYYSLYHVALALITNKKYASKNHYATILILIKEYSISKDEASLLHELSIKKEDAELYTQLKDDRHKASYQTNIAFTKTAIDDYENKVIDFLNKAEEMLQS